jgi:hypothetical protein
VITWSDNVYIMKTRVPRSAPTSTYLLGKSQKLPSGGGSAAAKGARTVTTGLLPHVLRWRGVGVTELETTVYM